MVIPISLLLVVPTSHPEGPGAELIVGLAALALTPAGALVGYEVGRERHPDH